jgi:hypothetical protein
VSIFLFFFSFLPALSSSHPCLSSAYGIRRSAGQLRAASPAASRNSSASTGGKPQLVLAHAGPRSSSSLLLPPSSLRQPHLLCVAALVLARAGRAAAATGSSSSSRRRCAQFILAGLGWRSLAWRCPGGAHPPAARGTAGESSPEQRCWVGAELAGAGGGTRADHPLSSLHSPCVVLVRARPRWDGPRLWKKEGRRVKESGGNMLPGTSLLLRRLLSNPNSINLGSIPPRLYKSHQPNTR